MDFKRFALAMVGHFLASLLYVLRRLKLINAVVDTSSILEHRGEIRELWEKRMMADDNNQSSPSSTVAEISRPSKEEGNEEIVVKHHAESETKPDIKLSNGVAKPLDSTEVQEDTNANHIHEAKANDQTEIDQITTQNINHDNNNCIDSLEEDNIEDYVEEKTYTSELVTSLVVKPTEDVIEAEMVEQTSTLVDKVAEEIIQKALLKDEPLISFSSSDDIDGSAIVQESVQSSVTHEKVQITSTEKLEEEIISQTSVKEQSVTMSNIKLEEVHQEIVSEVTNVDKQLKSLEMNTDINNEDEEGDGFVSVEECLLKVEGADDIDPEVSVDQAIVVEEQKTAVLNGHGGSSPATSTPEPTLDEKPSSPDIEQFVKAGGVKRIIPGVQKTEQPYSICTTETKIAMEIREMREREDELKLMREQAVLSPVASPVPPKSPSTRSPSPSIKEGASPTPNGCGYRVSSVFGHKSPTALMPSAIAEEEKRALKGLNKETAVEKEIRLARDREEELRKQKGLPPREDDSYVKPSQVKSSQVRVFGKVVGNNSVKQAATAKIQLEIEEQTQREMALRDTGSIQTISQERTDAKVAKLNTPETNGSITNGNSHPFTNGTYTNGRSSPDTAPYKRSASSPTGARPATIFSQTNGKSNISMHKFIASKGKEATFTAPRNGSAFVPKEEAPIKAIVAPTMVKLKRNVSVESKIQQEILEMKQREEELKLRHISQSNEDSLLDDADIEIEMNQKNNIMEYENGNGIHDEDLSPRHNQLIAQWEQRIQKAES